MNLHIIYRLCDKVDAVNGLKRPFGLDKAGVIRACFSSLAKSLEKMPWSITVIADDVTDETKEFISAKLPVESQILDFKPAIKNLGSLMKAYEVADSIKNHDTWVYFLEDDYLHDWNTFPLRLIDFIQFGNMYNFALPVFIHPTDYPDQYTRLLSRCYLYQTQFGYWREVCSTTGTFMCAIQTWRKFSEYIKSCGTDDGAISKIFKTKALCFSPMPGFATHMHEGVMSNYVNWEAIVKSV